MAFDPQVFEVAAASPVEEILKAQSVVNTDLNQRDVDHC